MAIDVGTSAARFARELDELIRARYPLVAIETFEEVRALGILTGVASSKAHADKGLYVWSRTRGLVQVAGPDCSKPKPIPGTEDPASLLEHIAAAERGLYVLCDFANELSDPMAPGMIARILRELVWSINGKDPRDEIPQARAVTIFLLGANWPEVPVLEKEIKRVAMPLPDRAEFRALTADRMAEMLESGIAVEDDGRLADRLAHALLGLTEQEAENALAKATVHCRGLRAESVRVVLDEKASIIRAIEGLEYEEPEEVDALGGYSAAHEFLSDAALTTTPEAEEFGVSPNKGALLVGPPGTGKTFTARVAAGKLQRPLLKMSMSAVMSAGGGVLGQAEGTMRRVLKMADVIQPILLIDEADRMFAGEGSSDRTDGGTTSRMVGEMMTWQAAQKGTMLVMTSNHPERIDPARFRSGRVNTVLFYDLPNATERAEIVAVHLKRKRRSVEDFDLRAVAAATEGFSGAEIEQVVEEAVLRAFKAGMRAVETADLLAAAASVNPLSKLAPEGVAQMRGWAVKHNAKRANSPELPEPEPAGAGRRGRTLEM